MTEIDVPDWVVEAALLASFRVACEHTGTEFSEDEFRNARDEHDRENRNVASEMMRAALTAALGAWVVPGPYRFLKNGDNPSDWIDREINGEPPNPKHLREEFSIQNAYTLRQEKPE